MSPRPKGDLEGVHRLVEPELVPGPAERLDQLAGQRVLRRDRERALHERVLFVRRVLRHERAQLGGERREDLPDLRRTHPGLVVLEEDVVRVVVRREALDVLARRSTMRSSQGRNGAKSESSRAFTQTSYDSAAVFSNSTASAAGTRRARSQSRFATRISDASSESWGREAA